MAGKSSKAQSLLTLLLDGLVRFHQPVFRVGQLRACDEVTTALLLEAGVLVKSRRATTWVNPGRQIMQIRTINGMAVAYNPDNPGAELKKIDDADLEQVILVPKGLATWIASTNGMGSPLEMEPGLWNLGVLRGGENCRFYLMLSESAHARVVELASRYPESNEVRVVLMPSVTGLTYKTLQQLPISWMTPASIASVCRDGRINLTAIPFPSMPAVITHADLSKQIEGIKQERIVEITEGQKLRDELGEIAGDSSELIRKMVEGFGSDSSMANLFILATGRNPENKAEPITLEQLGAQLGNISKQAVSARMKKMGREYPRAYAALQKMREKIKSVKYSEVSPKMRRKMGIDKSYGYEEDLRSD